MFAKLAIIFVTLLQISNGLPLETAQPAYDVKDFFSHRIVGGVEAPLAHAPHMVALIIGYDVRLLACGGSIITKRHVLSAAHCIEPFSHWGVLSPALVGIIGTNYWNSKYTEITFSAYVNHPHWDWNTIKNDVGILFTDREIRFNALIAPIAMHSDWMSGGELASVTGWGRLGAWEDIPYRLQVLNVTILTPAECYLRMKEALHNLGPAPAVDHRLEICTFHSTGHGMCNGDSGSGLMELGSRKLVGVVSWGYACALGAPDMYARISAYKGFIELWTGDYLAEADQFVKDC